jgi:pimeloyl-ACP methyl ester carboxylesterase
MQLFFRKYGSGGKNIIIAHGLYGCSDNWASIAKALSLTNNVFAVDLRNHGRSPHSDELSYDAMCSDLAEFIISKNIEKPIIIGYSMGGRCAALLAIQQPDLLSKIVIADISPFDCANQERILAFHKNILDALTTINLNEILSRSDAAIKLSEKINDVNLQNFLLKNLYRASKGGFLWRFNLPVILNNVNNITCGSLKKIGSCEIKIPTLLIKGDKSEYIVNTDIETIARVFLNLEVEIISGAGHWIHTEQSQNFIICVQKFIAK